MGAPLLVHGVLQHSDLARAWPEHAPAVRQSLLALLTYVLQANNMYHAGEFRFDDPRCALGRYATTEAFLMLPETLTFANHRFPILGCRQKKLQVRLPPFRKSVVFRV